MAEPRKDSDNVIPENGETPIWERKFDDLNPEERSRYLRDQTPETSSALHQVIEAHQLWCRTNGREGARICINGRSLPGISLIHCDLDGGTFTRTTFHGADLFQAELDRADMRLSFIRKARLGGVNLAGSDLRGSHGGRHK